MPKVTFDLPDDLKRAIEIEAQRQLLPEAEIIRQALRSVIMTDKPKPRGALFASSDAIGGRVDDLLDRFGE
ncbi:antitoxin [Flexivirga oryzae]|uniref:Ribbon-helix-helix protein, CopG family n=1 Tax=Flexivirga oryzae TaxID=1794944 RepID=A0A839NBL5_9MICO|nr:antitoxin [Flexivirga oryzae]MBB2893364.1 hypothetical protein [Flexivirga oryzae]